MSASDGLFATNSANLLYAALRVSFEKSMVFFMIAAVVLVVIALRSRTCRITFPWVRAMFWVALTAPLRTASMYWRLSWLMLGACSYCWPVNHIFSPVWPYRLAISSNAAPPSSAFWIESALARAASVVLATTCICLNWTESGSSAFAMIRIIFSVLSCVFSTTPVVPTGRESIFDEMSE